MSGRPPYFGSRRFAVELLVVVALVFFLAVGVKHPSYLSAHSNRTEELSHLKKLYIGIRSYTMEHEGAYPPDLLTVSRESGILRDHEFLNSPHLRYHKPPPAANEDTAPLPSDTVLLSYEDDEIRAIVTADGSGKAERR